MPEQVGETFCIQSNDHIAVPVEAMVDVSNVPSSLRKAVSAVLDNPDMAQRIAGELAMAGVSADELEILLDRAVGRDAWTNVARYALRDGFPSGLVTLALNLWGFEGFAQFTGDTSAAAALYGASLGSAIVVLDEVFRHMFEGMTYTPAELASAVPLAPYLAATTLPLTFRNIVRALAHVSLVLAGRPKLVADVDNGIEVVGGMLATMTTGHAMERLSLPGERERQRGILMREDLVSVVGQLRDGRAAHTGRLARQAGWAALGAVLDVPAGLRKLATPVGVVTVATLAAFVPAAVTAMAATRDAIHDDTPGVPEAAAELARVVVLSSAYLLLAGSARYAAPAFGTVGASFKRVGSACLTAASRMTSNHFTPPPGWYGLPHPRKSPCPTTP
ncbi:MAG TPA: hypothetical protein VK519_04000 [Pinirhizobacter sp.]|uniref:hypothetical protein n=1 Tax=Pinirhizobacter sp. TaxID=2950432 RepID=UPI002BE403BA|nr:hypothetical protein [Pinirhizobacter sp.]HMH67064.1 hypothetical protein [Pinirhizobacter sp.]